VTELPQLISRQLHGKIMSDIKINKTSDTNQLMPTPERYFRTTCVEAGCTIDWWRISICRRSDYNIQKQNSKNIFADLFIKLLFVTSTFLGKV